MDMFAAYLAGKRSKTQWKGEDEFYAYVDFDSRRSFAKVFGLVAFGAIVSVAVFFLLQTTDPNIQTRPQGGSPLAKALSSETGSAM